MSLVSIAEVMKLIDEDIPSVAETGLVFEEISNAKVSARLPFDVSSLRPGGTISGPTMMALADIVVFVCVLVVLCFLNHRCLTRRFGTSTRTIYPTLFGAFRGATSYRQINADI